MFRIFSKPTFWGKINFFGELIKAKQKITSSPLAITKELNDFLAELHLG